MDRPIVYTGQVPLSDDILRTNQYTMTALGMALQAILGTGTVFDGLNCTPTSPASMQVKVAPGSVYAVENLEGTAYSDLGSDTSHQIVKQGIVLDTTLFTITAPTTTGNSINYLIQGAYQDTDTDSVVLPYFNSSNPTVAFAGPANSGTSQNTTRKGSLVLSLKAGTSATTGTQTTPAADAGFTALWVVTVANGATTIISGNIAQAPGAPFIPFKLPQLSPSSGALLAANNLSDLGLLSTAITNLGFAFSIGADGYIKFPGGLILQWGGVGFSGAASGSASFPIAFPNNFFKAIAGDTASSTPAALGTQATLSAITLFAGSVGSYALQYFAIGN